MSARLIIEVIQTTLEEAAIAAVGLFGLPKLGVYIPLPVLAFIMLVWLVYSVFGYQKGTKALRRKPMGDMTGAKGIVVRALEPDGMIKVQGELWAARSSERIEVGAEVVITAKDGMRLIVVRASESNGGASRPVRG